MAGSKKLTSAGGRKHRFYISFRYLKSAFKNNRKSVLDNSKKNGIIYINFLNQYKKYIKLGVILYDFTTIIYRRQ